MKNLFEAAVKRLKRTFSPKSVRYQGLILPGRHLRFCGDDFRDDAYFVETANAEADRLIKYAGMNSNSRVLDVGCGYGRLPLGIINRLGEIALYQGVDVDRNAIQWCKKYIERNHPNYKFLKIDVKNPRYNPKGKLNSSAFRFPFDDDSFDIIFLFSVFSHMVIEDIQKYLIEFNRLLSPKGKIFLTAFVEENVPDMSINPEGYRREKWKGPLHCVRYNKNYLEAAFSESGFVIERFDYEKEKHGQSGYYLKLK
ncbi:MAG: hypothetical protein Kow0042_10840 [Calditrichia bacterium]